MTVLNYLFVNMIGLACTRYAGLRGPFRTGLIFLFHLAWKSRIRLPVLIAIGFMVLDIRLQLEINIDLGRRQGVPLLGNAQPGIELDDTDSEESLTGDDTSSSYSSDSTDLIFQFDEDFSRQADSRGDDDENGDTDEIPRSNEDGDIGEGSQNAHR